MSDPTDRDQQEFREARKAARDSRKAFAASPDSAFVQTMQSAIGQYLQARDQGVSREDGINGLEMELRGAWPKTVSRFAPDCDTCDDTGWIEHNCAPGAARCGRPVCEGNERVHRYVSRCFCPKGQRTQSRQAAPDGAGAAGKTRKRSQGFVRFGRGR